MAIGRAWRWLAGQPFLLLMLTTLMWSGHAVAGRLAVGQISPMTLTLLRWVSVCAALLVVGWRQIAADRPLLMQRWPSVLWMGALGYTGFNSLFYLAAYHTTAVNIAILQGSIPVFVLLGALLFHRTPIGIWQAVGLALTTLGVAAVAGRGEIETLRTLAFNIGDVWMLIACLLFAAYTLGLPNRPRVSGLAFLAATSGAALLTSLPLLAVEMVQGATPSPTLQGWAILLYVALFPSLLAQLFYMRGVELIGPGRAGLFVNLVPVFGPLLSVVILGEPFAVYHAVGLALVLGGIFLAERVAR